MPGQVAVPLLRCSEERKIDPCSKAFGRGGEHSQIQRYRVGCLKTDPTYLARQDVRVILDSIDRLFFEPFVDLCREGGGDLVLDQESENAIKFRLLKNGLKYYTH